MELMKAYENLLKHTRGMWILTTGNNFINPFQKVEAFSNKLGVLEILLKRPINTLNEDMIKRELLANGFLKERLGTLLNIQYLRSQVHRALSAMQTMQHTSAQKDKLIEVLTRLVNPTAPAAVRAAAGASAASTDTSTASTKRSGEDSPAASAGTHGVFATASGAHEVSKHNNLGK